VPYKQLNKTDTNHKSLIFRINILQKDPSMQFLLLYLRIFGQNLAHISYNVLREEKGAEIASAFTLKNAY